MATTPPSPFADQPFDVAAANTESAIEDWLKERKLSDISKRTQLSTMLSTRPWRHIRISGVAITTLVRKLWTSTRDSVRTNRYQLPAHFYIMLWSMLFLSALGLAAVGVPEGLEAAMDYKKNNMRKEYVGPVCGAVPIGRFYRIMARQFANALPLLVTLTIFFFPAVVRP